MNQDPHFARARALRASAATLPRLPSWMALLLVVLAACGLDPSKVPSHQVYANDEGVHEFKHPIGFAVVGSTRSVLYGAKGEPKAPQDIIDDLRSEMPVRGIEFVVLTGGFVRRSTNDEWKSFSDRWHDVLRGESLSDNKGRKKVLPMPGAGEVLGDRRLSGFGAAFPDVGREIGFNRTASWGHFDARVKGETWRFLFLDTHKRALGSRWQEQLFWLPKVVSGDEFDHLVVFMPDPLITLAKGHQMNPGDAPRELLDVIYDHSGVMALTAVITGGAPTNELYLPTGNFGELHLLAGNAGIGMPDLGRWGAADDAGLKDVALETGFDVSLLREFDRWASDLDFGDRLIDKAKARGEWATYTGSIDGGAFPIQGWWAVLIDGGSMTATFRIRRHDGTFHDLYSIRYTRKDGWVMGSL